jgi:hypothetical protein
LRVQKEKAQRKKLRLLLSAKYSHCGFAVLLDGWVALTGQVVATVSTRVTVKSVALADEPEPDVLLIPLLGLVLLVSVELGLVVLEDADEPILEEPVLEAALLGAVELELEPMLPVEPAAAPVVPPVLLVPAEDVLALPVEPVLLALMLLLSWLPSTLTCCPTLLLRSSELFRRYRWVPASGCR